MTAHNPDYHEEDWQRRAEAAEGTRAKPADAEGSSLDTRRLNEGRLDSPPSTAGTGDQDGSSGYYPGGFEPSAEAGRWTGRQLYHRWCGSSESDKALYFDAMNPAERRAWERLARELPVAEAGQPTTEGERVSDPSEGRRVSVNAEALARLLRSADPGGFFSNELGVGFEDDGSGIMRRLIETEPSTPGRL